MIGRRCRDVALDDALDVLAGVTIAHDVSARDHQFTTGQFEWSKSFDTFCPLGPEVVSLDEVDLAAGLALETTAQRRSDAILERRPISCSRSRS